MSLLNEISKPRTKESIPQSDPGLGAATGKLLQFNDNRPETTQFQQLQGLADRFSSGKHLPIQKKKNDTGLPDNLKSGIENLSGISMDDVKVHRHSNKPAQLNAHAYAQGTDIHLGSGQEKHLPHEAWHVVQQKQGRVKPTMQMKGPSTALRAGVNVNDDKGLEKEADVMGANAILPNRSVNVEKRTDSSCESYNPSYGTAQLKPVLGKITWGVTHAVKEVNGSIFGDGGYEEGEIGAWGELTSGEVVMVDDEDLFMSRRGANQERETNRDKDEEKKLPNVEWMRVLRIKGIDVKALNVFIRRETVHIGDDVVDPEAGWKPVKVEDVSWKDEAMLEGVKAIGAEYAEATKSRPEIIKGPNICSTPEMDQDDEGVDVAKEFLVESYRNLDDYPMGSATKIAVVEGNRMIGVMQITVEGETSDRYLYIKWLLGRKKSRGAGVALVRSALEYAIQNKIMKVKVESAMSAVEFYEKRGFTKVGNAQHMNDSTMLPDETSIDCGCGEMELQFYWDAK